MKPSLAIKTKSALEVFFAFLKLGLISFGGPIAHIGYFRRELVKRRAWVTHEAFSSLVSVCQFLPGPASSQLGFSLGLMRAGWLGAFAAFLGFTLPSAIIMVLFAYGLPHVSGDLGFEVLAGLKLIACIMVADALLSMTRQLCPDLPRKAFAVVAAVILLFKSGVLVQLLVILLAALGGLLWLNPARLPGVSSSHHPLTVSKNLGAGLLTLFLILLVTLPVLAHFQAGSWLLMDTFYRTGSFVFGGGHVVLPLLSDALVTPGLVTHEKFISGYGASQALPGPLFTFSAYLGALIALPVHPLLSALLALFAIFLPGFLLVSGILPFWQAVANDSLGIRAVAGVNAAVIGVLAAAFYNPVITSSVSSLTDVLIILSGLICLRVFKLPVITVLLLCVIFRVALACH